MARLWVIEAKFVGGAIDICDFTSAQFAYTNFYEAHKIKREIQEYLYHAGSRHWTKNTIRVKEYIPKRR